MSASAEYSSARPAFEGLSARVRSNVLFRRPELLALLMLAAVLDLWSLSLNGWANEYYSAAVRSMTMSWHNFLFASFDPAGVMTLDKPPLAFWVQALSARVFGVSSASTLVPQALMGVATVGLACDLVRRRFGRAAGFAGGLALALTPITVAIARHNNPDALLALLVTAAVWCIVRALDDGRTRWVVLAGVSVGLAFETKMAAALLVVPAIVAAYMWVAPGGRLRAARQLAAGGGVMAVVGLAWPVLVWLTPAADRPWVSGTADNSIWSLIFGYNGVGRLDGQAGGPGAFGGGGGGGPFGGESGVARLLNEALGGQAGWLLGAALVGGIALVVLTRLRRDDPRTGWLIAVGGAFFVTAAAFSEANGIFHPYYVSELAPFTAALVGAAVGVVLKGGTAGRVVGAAAVLAALVTELVVLHDNPGSLGWLAPLLGAGAVAAAIVLAGTRSARVRMATLAVTGALLLAAPATWAVQTLGHATNGTFPAGGPANAGGGSGGPGGGGRGGPGRMDGRPGFAPGGGPPGGRGFGGPGGGPGGRGNSAALTEALTYVAQNGGGTIGVSSQTGASTAIIRSGANVAGIGGFSGRESQVSIEWLADAVRDGRIQWVIAESTGGFGGGGRFGGDTRVGARDVMTAVQSAGRAVTLSSGTVLYDLQGRADALSGGDV
jgi:4-amino-4-deoxy-L-arabinose transferase-like glycosyltransferase